MVRVQMCEKTAFEQPFAGTVGVHRAKGLLWTGDDTKTSSTSTSRLLRINFYALLRTQEESPDPQGHQFSAIVQVRKLCTFGVQSALFGKYW